MCYSFRSSVITFSIAITTVFLMYMRQTKIDLYIAPLILTYAFMQFAEAFMWYDTSCGKINKIGTYIGYINLTLHLLAVGLGIYFVEKKIHGVIIGLFVFLYYLINMPSMKCSQYRNNTMYWGFRSDFYKNIYLIAVLLVSLSKMPMIYKVITILWYSMSWLYFFHEQFNIFSYFRRKSYDTNFISSLWCHICSLSAPGLYLIQNIIKP